MVLQFRTQLTINEQSSAISKPNFKRKQSSSSKTENKTTSWKSCCFAKSLGKRYFHFSKLTKFPIEVLSVTKYHIDKQLNVHWTKSSTSFEKKLFLPTFTPKRRFYSSELDKKSHQKISKNVRKQKPHLKTSQPLLQEIKRYFLYMLFFAISHQKNWFSILQLN